MATTYRLYQFMLAFFVVGCLCAPLVDSTVVQLVAGRRRTCARLESVLGDATVKTVKCWGDNSFGQLGYGDTNSRGDGPNEMGHNLSAVDLGTGRTAVELVAGFLHTCARLDNATVKCWGFGNSGRLGYGDTNSRGDEPDEMGDNLPTIGLGTGRTAVELAAGGFHTCARLDDATVKCWGGNDDGQLGYGDTNHRGDGPGEMGNILPAIDLGTGRTVVQLVVGDRHTCARLDDATVKCWGYGNFGQLGYGDANNRGNGPGEMGDNLPAIDLGSGRTAVELIASSFHTCARLDDATVKCWGYNLFGQLGYGDTNSRGDEPGEMGNNLSAIDLGTGRSAVELAATSLHTCARLDDATVKCWGYGNAGRLGNGDTNSRGNRPNEMGNNLPVIDLGTGRTAVEVVAASVHTCARLDDASVKCWGGNDDGQLGYGDTNSRGDQPGEMGDSLPAVQVETERTVVELVAKGLRTCVLLESVLDDATVKTVKCWGDNSFGQLGYGDTNSRGDGPNEMGHNLSAVDLGTGRTAVELAAGFIHACARLDDATVKCWGHGDIGRLGYGDTNSRGDESDEMGNNLPAIDLGTGRTAVELAAGGFHTCARLDDATVKCWGWNGNGQLGYGDTNHRGDGPGEMGNILPAIDLGTGRTVVQLVVGDQHTCARLDDATVKCWGYGNFGQLGYGDANNRGNGPGEMGDNLPAIDLGSGRTAVELIASSFHTCARLDDATVKCWGYNLFGQLGYGDTNSRGDEPGEMGNNLSAIDLGTGRSAVELAATSLHTCARLDDATVKCWGYGNAGRLGYGDTNSRGNGPNEMGNNLPAIDLGTGRTAVEVVAASVHTCVRLDDETVKCWGGNDYGQLGYGDTNSLGDQPGEMGDNLPFVNLARTASPSTVTTSSPTQLPTSSPTQLPTSSPSLAITSPTLAPTGTSAAVSIFGLSKTGTALYIVMIALFLQ